MKRQINTRWVMLVILLGLIMAIASCSGKKKPTSAEGIPSETQPTVTSPGHEMTEEALAEKHRKEEMEKLKNTAMQKFVNEDVFFDFDDSYLRPDAQEILKKKSNGSRRIPRFPSRLKAIVMNVVRKHTTSRWVTEGRKTSEHF